MGGLLGSSNGLQRERVVLGVPLPSGTGLRLCLRADMRARLLGSPVLALLPHSGLLK